MVTSIGAMVNLSNVLRKAARSGHRGPRSKPFTTALLFSPTRLPAAPRASGISATPRDARSCACPRRGTQAGDTAEKTAKIMALRVRQAFPMGKRMGKRMAYESGRMTGRACSFRSSPRGSGDVRPGCRAATRRGDTTDTWAFSVTGRRMLIMWDRRSRIIPFHLPQHSPQT
jgi:hypothetical protein